MVYPCDKVLDQADVDKINQYIQNNKLYKFTQFYPNLYKRDLPKIHHVSAIFPQKYNFTQICTHFPTKV